MRLSPMRPNKAAAREPLSSFKELAQHIGKTPAELRGIFARASDAPVPERVSRPHKTTVSYYRTDEFMAWWRRRSEA
jgi:hypothetical protein